MNYRNYSKNELVEIAKKELELEIENLPQRGLWDLSFMYAFEMWSEDAMWSEEELNIFLGRVKSIVDVHNGKAYATEDMRRVFYAGFLTYYNNSFKCYVEISNTGWVGINGYMDTEDVKMALKYADEYVW